MASRCQHLEQTLADETTKYEHKLLEQESKFEGQRVAMQTKISVLSSEIDVLKLEMSQAVPIVEASVRHRIVFVCREPPSDRCVKCVVCDRKANRLTVLSQPQSLRMTGPRR